MSMMTVKPLEIQGPLLVELKLFADPRGFFVERFNEGEFARHGLPTHYSQDNHSRSVPGVLRGLHFQMDPWQGKLVGVMRGRIWDVLVDLRRDSPSFGKWMGFELSERNANMLWIPKGFAHGFCVLGDEPADVLYKVDAPYNPAGESGIHWADPELKIQWPVPKPLVSARDEKLPSFASYRQRMA